MKSIPWRRAFSMPEYLEEDIRLWGDYLLAKRDRVLALMACYSPLATPRELRDYYALRGSVDYSELASILGRYS